jgi:RluA family pseudouridine synthase
MSSSPLPVLAAGKGWLAVDKPSGMSVHNDPGTDVVSLLTGFLRSNLQKSGFVDCEPDYGFHAVHRLDRETSGVVLLACRRDVFRYFSAQFAARKVAKVYAAIVHGRIETTEEQKTGGIWSRPLSAEAGGRTNPGGAAPRLESLTRFRVLASSLRYTLLECEPLTGRKHQIRRHAKLAGHPVVGDNRYGSRRAAEFLKNQKGFDRMGLHAVSLTIRPPGEESPVTIRSSGISEEILRLLDEDRQPVSPLREGS